MSLYITLRSLLRTHDGYLLLAASRLLHLKGLRQFEGAKITSPRYSIFVTSSSKAKRHLVLPLISWAFSFRLILRHIFNHTCKHIMLDVFGQICTFSRIAGLDSLTFWKQHCFWWPTAPCTQIKHTPHSSLKHRSHSLHLLWYSSSGVKEPESLAQPLEAMFPSLSRKSGSPRGAGVVPMSNPASTSLRYSATPIIVLAVVSSK
jgi:hypothetical protein